MTTPTVPSNALWRVEAPAVTGRLVPILTGAGSLTERLIALGSPFSVQVLGQGRDEVAADEAALLGVDPGSAVLARHVALLLDAQPVVVARSVTPWHDPVWTPVLERGSRSLGFTLFGELNDDLIREPLSYAMLDRHHPLFALTRAHDAASAERYVARRSRFLLGGSALIVCEVFLPSLDRYLP
ncbi:chorismate lyase [Crenobacter sp. SG2303]|uniref:Chorismate lyase n=1 Tax=Crenobacter oryzisoli TaxID=3056844 RepID=A0ABT7XIE8_9NEIS|nr:chorismate lyase [Crenobacter sp. SG2303]MDN0073344.1 chorismate lyase [Crenobacter sp. SG2303]